MNHCTVCGKRIRNPLAITCLECRQWRAEFVKEYPDDSELDRYAPTDLGRIVAGIFDDSPDEASKRHPDKP